MSEFDPTDGRFPEANITQHSSPEQAEECWYAQSGAIKHWFHGVFEGGGAKGVAYSGALQAMAERPCWVAAVAGASAGAITAALIAARLARTRSG